MPALYLSDRHGRGRCLAARTIPLTVRDRLRADGLLGLGDDCCRCQEIDAAVTANAPVLAMCRQLLATGVDPDRPLRVYRRGALALKVRSIREGARLTVKIAGNGTPIFTLDYPCKGAAAPPARSKPDFDLRCQVSKNSLRAEGATVTVAARAQGSGSRLGAAPRSEFALQR